MSVHAETEIEIHPLASVYRMHTSEEMEMLVASISKNGLRDPITLAQDGRLIDGRNRLAACLAAGVEPKFETFDGDEAAIAEYIHDKNSARRDLTTGQKALAYALLYPAGGRGTKNDSTNGIIPSANRISDARDIIKYAPGDIEAIKQGDEPFTKIVEKAKSIKRQQEPSETRVAKLAKSDPRLADMVRQGELSIEAAEAEIKVLAERLRERQDKAIDFLRRSVSLFSDLATGDFQDFMVDNLADPLFRARLVQTLEFDENRIDSALSNLDPAAETLRSVITKIREKI